MEQSEIFSFQLTSSQNDSQIDRQTDIATHLLLLKGSLKKESIFLAITSWVDSQKLRSNSALLVAYKQALAGNWLN